MKSHPQSKPNAQIHREACEWFVEFRAGEPDETSRKAFFAWLRESPAHMGAYLDVTAIWAEGATLELEKKWPMDALIAQAAHDPDNIVAHPTARPVASTTEERAAGIKRWPGRAYFAAAASVLMAFAAGLVAWRSDPSYSTGIGEQRSIVFPDGSTVNLNSRSQIRIHYSRRERAVELLRGQALFSVAKDAARPFIVSTDSMQVRAIGTQFDVYRKRGGTVVTVVEGEVAANAVNTATDHSILLAAGQQFTVAAGVAAHPTPANIAHATAWTQRELVFESTPLEEVAQEFNRYNERQLVVRDAKLNAFEIDGVFRSTDPSSLVRFLRQRPGVRVIETDSEIVIASR